MEKIRALIVDDHPMMREALRTALEAEQDLEVIAESANGRQAVNQARSLHPDVIVMDLLMPEMDGLQATAEILQNNPAAQILIITSSLEDEKVVAAVQAGAMGYLLKDASRQEFLRGIREVARGQHYFPPGVTEKLARGLRQAGGQAADRTPKQRTPAHAETLTAREEEVLRLIGEGLTNGQIAARLCLSESTVRVHVFNLLDKLRLENRNQAILYASEQAKKPK